LTNELNQQIEQNNCRVKPCWLFKNVQKRCLQSSVRSPWSVRFDFGSFFVSCTHSRCNLHLRVSDRNASNTDWLSK